MEEQKKFIGVKIIGWSIIVSNLSLLLVLYLFRIKPESHWVRTVVSFVSMTAVFPIDFFYMYLREFELVHLFWIGLVTFSSIDILRLNPWARIIFIVLNIVHAVCLTYLVLWQMGKPSFLDYFFKLYFNLVAVGTFVGFLTIAEVRAQFPVELQRIKLKLWFKKIIRKEPTITDATSYYNLGLAYSRLERLSEASEALLKAIAIEPHNPRIHFELSKIYAKKKDHANAIKGLREALRLDPNLAEAYYLLGLMYQQEGCDQEAIEVLEKGRILLHRNPQVFKSLGKSYMSVDRFKEAIEALQRAILLNPKDDDSYFQLGIIYLNKLEQYKEAQEALRTSVRLNPGSKEALFSLGMSNVKLKRYKDALRAFKEVIRLDANHAQAHYYLGLAYATIEDFDSARREQKILKVLDVDLANSLELLFNNK